MNPRALVLLLFVIAPFAWSAERPPISEYEKILLPVYGGASGANGAMWRTRFLLRNDGDAPLDVFPLTPTCLSSSLCYMTMRAYPAFPPRQTGYSVTPFISGSWGVGTSSPSGAFLYVERSRAQQLSANYVVADYARNPVRETHLPLVRESEFFTGTRSIVSMPVSVYARTALRIYDLDSRPTSEVIVRFYDAVESISPSPTVRKFGEVRVTLSYDAAADACGFSFGCPPDIAYHPGYGEISNLLAAVPAIYDARNVRIEIEPVTEGLRYWPMVTITDDFTNFVSIYTVR